MNGDLLGLIELTELNVYGIFPLRCKFGGYGPKGSHILHEVAHRQTPCLGFYVLRTFCEPYWALAMTLPQTILAVGKLLKCFADSLYWKGR